MAIRIPNFGYFYDAWSVKTQLYPKCTIICYSSIYENLRYSCNNITRTLIQISRLFYFGFFSKSNHQMMIKLTPKFSRSKSMWFEAQRVQKYALNSQLQALQILTNDDEVKN